MFNCHSEVSEPFLQAVLKCLCRVYLVKNQAQPISGPAFHVQCSQVHPAMLELKSEVLKNVTAP